MWADYFKISWASLKKRSMRSWLTMIGIFVGIATVVALISLGQGMADAINGQFASLGTDKIILQGTQAGFGPPGQLSAGVVTDHDLKLVRRISGVKRAAGRLLKSVNVELSDHVEVMFVGSLPKPVEDRELVLESLNLETEEGRMLKPSETGKVVIGHHWWSEKHFPKDIVVGTRLLINGRTFEVVGLLEKGSAFGNDALLMNEADLKKIADIDDELSAVVAQVNAGEDPEEVAERVLRAVRRDRGQKEGFEDVTVETSAGLIDSINVILGVVQAVFIGIALISLLVGGIGIMNTMYTAVLERTNEIGVMKAIGARNKDIMMLFLVESGLLGLFGGAIGVLLGIGMSKIVEVIGRGMLGDLLRASFSIQLIVGALTFSFLIGAISGAFPARQASKMHPVEALRSD